MLPRLLSLLAPLASLASLTSLVSIASLAPLASAQTNLTEPSFLPNSGVVLSPPQNATLKADGGLVHIQYNGIGELRVAPCPSSLHCTALHCAAVLCCAVLCQF